MDFVDNYRLRPCREVVSNHEEIAALWNHGILFLFFNLHLKPQYAAFRWVLDVERFLALHGFLAFSSHPGLEGGGLQVNIY